MLQRHEIFLGLSLFDKQIDISRTILTCENSSIVVRRLPKDFVSLLALLRNILLGLDFKFKFEFNDDTLGHVESEESVVESEAKE